MIQGLPSLTVERLSNYRRVLNSYQYLDEAYIFSHHLARHVKIKAATVRRDLMLIDITGDQHRGYKVSEVLSKIAEAIDPDNVTNICFVGMGHLGSTIMEYLNSYHSRLKVMARFSLDETVDHSVEPPSYSLTEIQEHIRSKNIKICALAVAPDFARELTTILMSAGITGILNFSPVRLQSLKTLNVENFDIVSKLERMAYETNPNHKKAF